MRKLLLLLAVLAVFLPSILAGHAHAASATNSNDIVVETIPGPTAAQKLTQRAKSSWPWYIARASGLVAAVSLVVLLLSGVGQVTGYTFRYLEPLTAWASHRALGIAFSFAVLIHMFSLLLDKFVPFTLLQVLVPWLSHYKPVTWGHVSFGSLWVALGVLAFYLVAAVLLTSLVWIDKKPYTWKLVHLTSYLLMLFVFVHALYLGTDLAHGYLRLIWVLAGLAAAVATLHRLWRAKTV